MNIRQELHTRQSREIFKKEYEDDILLVLFDHRLRELGKSLKSEGTIEFITAKQDPGKKAYRRSTTLLLQKAVDNLYGKDGVSIQIRHSLGQGYYCTLKGAKEDISDLILSIKIEMMRLVDADISIGKELSDRRCDPPVCRTGYA